MDPTSAVRTDALPVLATVVGPGAVVTAPYLAAVGLQFQDLKPVLEHEALVLTSTALVWVIAGFIVESVGSYVEVYWIDRGRKDHDAMIESWWRYLRIAWDKEPTGQHYLRKMLVSFKFELNMFVALLGCIPGVVLLGVQHRITDLTAAGACAFLILAASLLFNYATGSAQVLADLRMELLKGVGLPPFDQDGNPQPQTPVASGGQPKA
jgi:hypothetical protein